MHRRLCFFAALTVVTGCLQPDSDIQFGLQLVIEGPGAIQATGEGFTQTCDQACTIFVAPRTEVVLVALPEVANGFRRWDQPLCGASIDCSFVVDGTRTVTANFYDVGDALWAASFNDVTPPLPHLSSYANGDNLVVLGLFGASLDLGTGPVAGPGASNLFRAEFDPNGDVLSIQVLASADELFAQASPAPNGELFVSGWFSGNAEFGDGPRVSGSPSSLFVAKYSTAGAALWVIQADSVDMAYLDHVGVHATGNNEVVIRANFLSGSFSLGGGVLTAGPQGQSTVLARLDTNGGHIWSHTLGNAKSDNLVTTLDLDDDVLISGNFTGNIDIDGTIHSSLFDGRVLLAEFSGVDGSRITSQVFSGDTDVRSVHVDPDGDIYINAFVAGTVNFGGGDLVNAGSVYAPVIAKFDSSHTFTYSTIATGSGWGLFHDLVFTGGDILATGVAAETLTFGIYSVIADGFSDAVLLRLDASTGEPLWLRSYGGENADSGYRTTLLSGGDAVMLGGFRTSTNIDSIELSAGLTLTPFATRLIQLR